ncbi:MAG TPA: long-chain fatty acid--CoA ligase [Thermoplasmata archaeon]|nr:long-chain fatty acid--CoA ligase [Thermoplasmata archaeon]
MEGLMMDEFPLTIAPILARTERVFPRVAISSRLPDGSVRRTDYGTVIRRGRSLAAAIRAAGLGGGDRVGTLMWNHAGHLEAYLGVPASGAVLHTLNLRLPPDQLAYVIDHARDRWILVDDVLLPLLARIREKIHPEKIVVVPFSGAPVPDGFDDYEQLLAAHAPLDPLPELNERDAAGLCYTSGTTGRLKGVLYSQRSLVLHSIVAASTLDLRQRDAALVVVPMFHVNAWGLPYVMTLLGGRMVLPGRQLDPPNLLDLMEQERVTYAAGVPSIWVGILEALEGHPGRCKLAPELRMLVGGSAVPETMIRRFAALGIDLIHGYGMTESSPLATVNVPKEGMRDWEPDRLFPLRARQGLPGPFVEIRLRAENRDLPWDGKTVGELELRGPWIARAYFHDSDPDKWTSDRWMRTGDVATIDPEGYVQIVDRSKDLVKSGGEWISSVALENALVAHPAVREAAIVAKPDPKWTERPLAFVVLKEGANVTGDELREFLAPQFPKWWLPDEVRFVSELPKTSTGKVSKLTLRGTLGQAAGRGVTGAS